MDYDYYINAMAQQSEANNVFNAEQARINREFQQEMSSTAHQREVKDLIAAGLNPILSANAGASTAAGSMATADTSSASGYAQLAQTGMQGVISMALAQINTAAQIQSAMISAQAVTDAAQKAFEGTVYATDHQMHSKPLGIIYDTLDSLTKNISGGFGIQDVWQGLGNWIDLYPGMFAPSAAKRFARIGSQAGNLGFWSGSAAQQHGRYRW